MQCSTCKSIKFGKPYQQRVWSASSLLPLWNALRRPKSAGKPSALQTLREFGCSFAAQRVIRPGGFNLEAPARTSGVSRSLNLFAKRWILFFASIASSALATTIPVTSTISQAVDQANEGDTVLVSGPRVFHEHIALAKSIRLLGTNSPVIDADGSGSPLTITAPECEARGLIIRNSGHDLGAFDSGIMITAPRAAIQDCRIEVDAFGVYLRGAGECIITQNEIFGGTNLASNARGNGIHLWKTQRNRILGNTIHDKRDGMYFSYANENVIAGNNIWNTRFGIHYMYSHQNQLLTNSLAHNTVGATLMFSRQSTIAGNMVYANRRHGMVFKQVDNSRILANIVSSQNRGFFVQQANQNRFEGNIIATNDIGLYLSNCSEQNAFVGNSFIRNVDQVWQPPFETEQGRKAPNTFTENGRGNYWSDYTGTDRNRDGIGDTPYHETDVFGYLVDRYPATRIFALSPALTLLRKGEDLLPLLDTPGITDTAPLMISPTERGRLAREFTSAVSLSQR